MAHASAASDPSLDLELHFGANADDAEKVLDALAHEPSRVWRAEDILATAGIESITTGLIVLARLTHLGRIAHPSLGAYQAQQGAVIDLRRPA